MLLLVSKHRLPDHPNVGRLAIPRYLTNIEEHSRTIPWAADNDCFQGLDANKFCAMLDRLAPLNGCMWISIPDVVGDADATWERWCVWRKMIADVGPPAFVLQDGVDYVPWDELGAVFIGGSDEFKLGPQARQIVADARRRGLYAHMGRVNSLKRMRYAASIGCTSVDGTCWSRWDRTHLRLGLEQIANASSQTRMEVA